MKGSQYDAPPATNPSSLGLIQRAAHAEAGLVHDVRVDLNGYAVLVAFARAHEDLQPVQVHVLDAQPQQLGQAQSAAVHQLRHQARSPFQLTKEPLAFLPGQHGRHAPSAACRFIPAHVAGVRAQGLAEEEYQGIERLLLRGHAYPSFDRQPREEFLRGTRKGATTKQAERRMAVTVNMQAIDA